MKTKIFILLFLLVSVRISLAVTYTSVATNGNWGLSSTWSPAGIPGTVDSVIIAAGNTVNIDGTYNCSNLTVNGTLNFTVSSVNLLVSGNVIINGTGSIISSITNTNLNISGNLAISSGANAIIGGGGISITGITNIDGMLTLNNNIGTKTFGDINIGSTGTWDVQLAIPFTINGNITNNGTFNANTGIYTLAGTGKSINATTNISIPNLSISGLYNNNTVLIVGTALSGAGTLTQGVNSLLKIGGTLSLTTLNTSVNIPNAVEYNGINNQTIKPIMYYNLNINNSLKIASFSGTTGINNDFNILSGIGEIGAVSVTVSGNTLISGTLNIINATGTKSFNNVIINSSGTWNNSGNTPITINGNLQNDGTFTAGGGTYTLAGTSKTLSGTIAISIPILTITGSYVNTSTLISSSFSGSGSLSQGVNSLLKLSGVITVAAFDASANPNTVEYNGIGAQTVKVATYHNLNINKSTGTATFGGNITVNNDFNIISGTADIAGIDISVSGNTNISGNLSLTSAIGTKTFNNIIINSSGFWDVASTVAVTVNGNLQNNGILSSLGNFTLSGAGKTISGISGFNFSSGSVEISGSYTNNSLLNFNDLTISNSLTNNDSCSVITFFNGTGSFIQGINSKLNILVPGANFNISILDATASGNKVYYSGSTGQNIKPTTYFALIIANTAAQIADFSGTTNITNDFLIKSGGVARNNDYNINVDGNTVIYGTFNITGAAGTKTFNNITINNGGVWNESGGYVPITVNGNLQIDGAFDAGTGPWTLTGNSKSINGTGSFMISNCVINGSYTNNSDINVNSQLDVYSLNGSGSLTQGLNSVLAIRDSSSISTLLASSNPNLIYYWGAGSYIAPITYYKLWIDAGTGTATLKNNITVIDTLKISSGTLSTGPYNIDIKGNWINNDTLTGIGTVTFTGANQNISGTSQTNFYNLTINNTLGSLTLASNIGVSNTLTMTSGNINTSVNKVILGTSTGNPGTLNRTSGTIFGKFERWLTSTGVEYLFPIGTNNDYRPLNITFTNLSPGSLAANFIVGEPGALGLPLIDGSVSITNQFSEGYWALDTAYGLATTDYNINLTANGFTSFPLVSSTRIIKRTLTGSWMLDGSHLDAVGPKCFSNSLTGGITDGTQFGLGKTDCAVFSTSPINGPDKVCANTGVNYSVTYNPANTYNWTVTGGTIATGQGTSSISVNWGSTEMTGNLQVVESNGCNSNTVDTIINIYKVNSSIIPTAVLCNGGSDGIADLTPGGGVMPYSYNWSNFMTTEDIYGLTSAMYYVTITDGIGCLKEDSILINEPAILTATISSSTNVNCNEGNNGSVTVTASGGISPYTYNWNTAPAQTTPTASNLSVGTYSVTVTDANACIVTAPAVTITQPPLLTASIFSQLNVSCNGGNNGQAIYTATGGTAPYTFTPNDTIINLIAGNYGVTVTDANACIVTAPSVTITQPPLLTASIFS
ncbi:MAG: hypothetical protein HY958_08715, partial [Bacteroidia bacterium]|nr:hypothetical protein [Bacteroidia bacterium]